MSPGFSSTHLPSAWGLSSCLGRDRYCHHHLQTEVEVVEEVEQGKAGVKLLVYKASLRHCRFPFLEKCLSLEVSSRSSKSLGMKPQNQLWTQSPSHSPRIKQNRA